MPETLDVDALNAAAAQKAHENDAAGAAQLLRQALDLQAAALGPAHRDLAPTLNNLALMLERQGALDEAENCYRRAYAIAQSGAAPDDPLVLVSRSNLIEFLRAAGRPEVVDPVETPPREPAPTPVVPKPGPRPAPAPAPTDSKPAHAPTAPAPQAPQTRTAVTTPAGPNWSVIAIAAVILIALILWLVSGRSADSPAPEPVPVAPPAAAAPPAASPPPSTAPAPQASAAPPPSPAAPAREPPPKPNVPSTGDAAPPTKETPPAARPAPRPQSPGEFGRPRNGITADGDVCASLTRTGNPWRCAPLGDRSSIDAVYYYTRVRSPRDVVVRHRWTYAGTVIRTVDLRVSANNAPGFRTFSRQRTGGRRGQWEVALLAPDGTVVDSQSFAVK
jgi:hypothetical protein